ncbi:MAG: YggS family pyridoxal phosphate-dependent enzyme [Bacteroidales bacterium]|nr:YggS family pyridoxal phosphate-dependent enzyme [Bacteroidales bacterium]HOI31942.1 YggS family pyridoxal phosphate-dependent enzyme [Bacteroidales bacterium]
MSHSVSEKLKRIKQTIPEQVKLVAVSKTKPVEDIMEAYQAGQICFGENKAQEMEAKQALLPANIEWHFIGHLQTNKVKYITAFVSLIEAVDSLKLLKEINKQASRHSRIIPCLLQFHIAEEESKFGLNREEASALLESEDYKKMKNIKLAGVMGMATFTDDLQQVRREFIHLREIFNWLKTSYFIQDEAFKEISMGMSGDYPIAIEEGATIVRVGSLIFGERNYSATE